MELYVSSRDQRVELRDGAHCLWSAPVSTSQFGMGEMPNSGETPRGWHVIAEKIGAGAPLNAIFESREFTGRIWDGRTTQSDLILTRILWLAGEEESNRSTQMRYIYFHGTNHEGTIGTPGSHGCVRLKNSDMLALFERVETGTRVYIE